LAGNICIFLAGLGLFGLASLAIVNRTKEIGIRKVLGASVVSVVSLLCRDFIKLVIIAIVIASPIAWYVMNQWLQNFAYKIEIKWWMFVVTGLLAVALAMLTVSVQAIKAALISPSKSLPSE
jgi:putative ABC transport system permease protein